MSRAVPRFRRTNPTLPSIGAQNVFNIRMVGTVDNQMWVVNFAVIGLDTLSANSELNIASTWDTGIVSQFRACLTTGTMWNQTIVTCVNVPARAPYVANVNAGAGYAGTVAEPHLPIEMAVIISKQTGTKGQHGRGRVYMPAPASSFVNSSSDANRLGVVGTAAYSALVTQLLTNPAADGGVTMTGAVYTRVPKGAAVTNAAPITSTGYILKTLLGTVRRRRIGRGK